MKVRSILAPLLAVAVFSLVSCADECCTYTDGGQEITECRNDQVNRGDWGAMRGHAISQGGVCE